MRAFYLGRPYNLRKKKPVDSPVLYDSRDLLTHAVCVGMTGSGKTGLCLSLLEAAAIDGREVSSASGFPPDPCGPCCLNEKRHPETK